MATIITTDPVDEGALGISIAFTDENGGAVTPSAASWTLKDRVGNVINSREDVTISSLSTTVYILLEGDDLNYTSSTRYFTIEYTYTSDTYGEVTDKDILIFYVQYNG